MQKNYHIEKMSQDDLALAIDWAANEGWNPGLHDADCFYQADPNGFFAGKLNGKIITVGSMVLYDPHYAFFGLYIADPAYRGHGYGLSLTHAMLAYAGSANIGMDGVATMCPKYARLGFKLAHQNARYVFQGSLPSPKRHPALLPLSQIDFKILLEYDRRYFPASRNAFLACWIKQVGGSALGFYESEQLRGYGVIRPCREGYKIGPLFAETPEIAELLFLNLGHHAQGQRFYLDIPECQLNAAQLVARYQMKKVFTTARMYLKEPISMDMDSIYGITTFELG